MAELEQAPASDCCSAEAQADCCEPADKDGCCSAESSACGCGAGYPGTAEIREAVSAHKPAGRA